VEAGGAPRLAFSILFGDFSCSTEKARRIQDQMVVHLARWAQAAAEVSPQQAGAAG
jgi:hypothetical protein